MNPIRPGRAPLRTSIVVSLAATPAEVWELVGDLTRFPEYSSGLDAVRTTLDDQGRCLEYVCRFKPASPDEEAITHRELVSWYEPLRGFTSDAEEPNPFGITRATTRVMLEPSGEGHTHLTWEQYFDAEDVDTMQEEFGRALGDIGTNLVRRFGGQVIHRTGA